MTTQLWVILILGLYLIIHSLLSIYFLHFNFIKRPKCLPKELLFGFIEKLQSEMETQCMEQIKSHLKQKLKAVQPFPSPDDEVNEHSVRYDSSYHYKHSKVFPQILDLQNRIKARFALHGNDNFPYKYIIKNENICDKKLYLLNFLLSGPADFQTRLNIRNMWGSPLWRKQTGYQLINVLGVSQNESVNSDILKENQLYGDIVQLDFIDSYDNLTLKVLSGLHWATNYCPNAEWILKSDSDVIVNIFSLTKFLKLYDKKHKYKRSHILCKPKASHELIPFRNNADSKWNVDIKEYPFDSYPIHCFGPAYIIPRILVPKFYAVSDKRKPFRMEDAYYTGIVPLIMKENVHIFNIGPLIPWRPTVWPNPEEEYLMILEMERYHAVGSTLKVWKTIVSTINVSVSQNN